jgi:hypothetical protein
MFFREFPNLHQVLLLLNKKENFSKRLTFQGTISSEEYITLFFSLHKTKYFSYELASANGRLGILPLFILRPYAKTTHS